MRRYGDDERWAAAASIARRNESPDARRLRRRRQWLLGTAPVLAVTVMVLVVALTPLRELLFPSRETAREPAGWQVPLGLVALAGSVSAFIRWRTLNHRAHIGSWLPLVDPRTVLRAGQTRAVDRWIRSGVSPEADRAAVVFDRAVRCSTYPSPVWQLLMLPLSFSALTISYRGPVEYLVALWVGWAVVTLLVWSSGDRFRTAAAGYAATHGILTGPVVEPAPEP